MSLAPGKVLIIPPDEFFTASGYRKLNGSEGRELYWDITNITDLDDIVDRTGGTSATSILGAIRCEDWIPRSSSAPTYSIYLAFLDQPIRGEFRQGPNRYNLMVRVRRMILSETLS